MSAPIDQEERELEKEHVVAMGGEDEGENAPLCPPRYGEAGGCSRCRFKGPGRRGAGGSCNRRGRSRLTFFQRFWILFISFFALSTLYTNRDAILPHFKALGNAILSIIPTWISTAWSSLGYVANIPFAIWHIFGLLFFSALASLVITSLRARLVHMRRLRFQEWKKNGGGHHRHSHHRHGFRHHRHSLESGSGSGDEQSQGYKDDVEKVAANRSTPFTVEE